ncbi:MAG: 4Fe-4S ferredoxin [Spirochaetaceae bacterium]|nr:MAG: 4Fe-4S ferredoxin [Spirochaetaceae bacterium]
MYASRNIRLCNKDCVCLFVCPTGATDTETGQIDRLTCVDGCRICVDACPSHAIHLVVEHYPEPGPKSPSLTEAMIALCERKSEQERTAIAIADVASTAGAARLARALARSARILAEDCAREAGYMIPQCDATRELLGRIATDQDGEIRAFAEQLRGVTALKR